MPVITRLVAVSGITVGPDSTVLPDHSIQNPVSFEGVNITFDDGTVIQVERPLTLGKIQAALAPATASPQTFDGFTEGMNIP